MLTAGIFFPTVRDNANQLIFIPLLTHIRSKTLFSQSTKETKRRYFAYKSKLKRETNLLTLRSLQTRQSLIVSKTLFVNHVRLTNNVIIN